MFIFTVSYTSLMYYFLNQQFIIWDMRTVYNNYKVAMYIQMETTWRRKMEGEKKKKEKENENESKRIKKSMHKSTK